MKTLTIQQAIYLSSTLRSQLDREVEKFQTDYRMPIAVNGKSIVTDEKSEQVLSSLNRIDALKKDIMTLKTAVHHANSSFEISYQNEQHTASSLLEQLKLDRQLINRLRNATTFGYGQERMKTVSGVGVVEEGIIEEKKIQRYIEQTEQSADEKSMLIDQFNATTTIDVALLTM